MRRWSVSCNAALPTAVAMSDGALSSEPSGVWPAPAAPGPPDGERAKIQREWQANRQAMFKSWSGTTDIPLVNEGGETRLTDDQVTDRGQSGDAGPPATGFRFDLGGALSRLDSDVAPGPADALTAAPLPVPPLPTSPPPPSPSAPRSAPPAPRFRNPASPRNRRHPLLLPVPRLHTPHRRFHQPDLHMSRHPARARRSRPSTHCRRSPTVPLRHPQWPARVRKFSRRSQVT